MSVSLGLMSPDPEPTPGYDVYEIVGFAVLFGSIAAIILVFTS
jgi:hypothetical protein